MEDQLLKLARLTVIGLPGFKFGVMGQKQLGQVLRVLAVILGPAGQARPAPKALRAKRIGSRLALLIA